MLSCTKHPKEGSFTTCKVSSYLHVIMKILVLDGPLMCSLNFTKIIPSSFVSTFELHLGGNVLTIDFSIIPLEERSDVLTD